LTTSHVADHACDHHHDDVDDHERKL